MKKVEKSRKCLNKGSGLTTDRHRQVMTKVNRRKLFKPLSSCFDGCQRSLERHLLPSFIPFTSLDLESCGFVLHLVARGHLADATFRRCRRCRRDATTRRQDTSTARNVVETSSWRCRFSSPKFNLSENRTGMMINPIYFSPDRISEQTLRLNTNRSFKLSLLWFINLHRRKINWATFVIVLSLVICD